MSTEADARILIDKLLKKTCWCITNKAQVSMEGAATDGRTDYLLKDTMRAASPGSAGRNRTPGLKKLEKIFVSVPDYDKQKRFSKITKRRQLIQSETAGIEDEVKAFTATLLTKTFRERL